MRLNIITLAIRRGVPAVVPEYTMDGTNDHIQLPVVTLALNDVVEIEFKITDKTALVSFLWNSAPSSVNRVYMNATSGILAFPNYASMIFDGSTYANEDVADGLWHKIEITCSAASEDVTWVGATFSPAIFAPATFRNLKVVRIAPSGANPDLHWPINDGWINNPTIKEILVGDGTWDGTAITFQEGGWSAAGTAPTYEYTFDGIDDHIVMAASVGVLSGDSIEFDWTPNATAISKVNTIISKSTSSSFVYTGSSGLLRNGSGTADILVDGVGYADNTYQCVADVKIHIKVDFTGTYDLGDIGHKVGGTNITPGIIENVKLTRPGSFDLFWPIHDGWAANPTIIETSVGGGTWDITATNFVEGNWALGTPAGPAPVLSAGPRYGSGWSYGSLSNKQANVAQARQFMSFRAVSSSDVTSVRWYHLGDTPGYSAGNPTTMEWSIEGDNGSGMPDGVPIGTTVVPSGLKSNPVNFLHDWPTDRPTLVAGELYFLICINTDPSPDTNNYSIDYFQQLGTIIEHEGRWNPQVPNDEFFVGWTTAGSNTWSLRDSLTAIFDLTMADGTHNGIGYINTNYMNKELIGDTGQAMVRQRITPTADVIVTGGGICMAGSGGSVLVELTDSGGTVLRSYTTPGTSFPVADWVDPSRDDATWEAAEFVSNITLTSGTLYYLQVSSAAGTFRMAGNRDGDSYGYHPSLSFPDGYAQYTTDGGTTWLNMQIWDSPTTIIDLKFYLNTLV